LFAVPKRGHVHWSATLDETRARLMVDWSENPDRSAAQFVYASTNVEVNRINEMAKAIRIQPC
jgi:hypothetical protein